MVLNVLDFMPRLRKSDGILSGQCAKFYENNRSNFRTLYEIDSFDVGFPSELFLIFMILHNFQHTAIKLS